MECNTSQIYRIGDLGKVVTGKTPPTKNKENFGEFIPFVTPGDLQGKKHVYDAERYLSEEGLGVVKNKLIPAGSIMVSCIGTVGEIAIAGVDCVTNQQINSIVPSKDFSGDYIYYDLKQRKQELQTFASGGSVVPIINKTDFSDLEIKLPAIEEQNRIASILSAFDEKIELNQRMNETLESIARVVFKSWFVDFDPVHAKMAGEDFPLPDEVMALFPDELVESELGMIPKGWEVGKLGDYLTFEYGKSLPKKKRNKGDIPVYGSNGIIGEHNKKLVSGPGVIIGRKGNPGIVSWSFDDYFCIDTTFYCLTKLPLEFSYFLLASLNLSRLSADSAVPGLNRNIAYLESILIPDISVINYFSTSVRKLFNYKFKISNEGVVLKKLVKLLINSLIFKNH
jgi:type I restriction enzyme, S subunit